jgi:hypothetical protein
VQTAGFCCARHRSKAVVHSEDHGFDLAWWQVRSMTIGVNPRPYNGSASANARNRETCRPIGDQRGYCGRCNSEKLKKIQVPYLIIAHDHPRDPGAKLLVSGALLSEDSNNSASLLDTGDIWCYGQTVFGRDREGFLLPARTCGSEVGVLTTVVSICPRHNVLHRRAAAVIGRQSESRACFLLNLRGRGNGGGLPAPTVPIDDLSGFNLSR